MIRNVDELPWLRRILRLTAPAVPPLSDWEIILFSFPASRVARRFHWWRLLLPGLSFGRLTLTNVRLIYQTRRDPNTLFITRPPAELGSMACEMEDVYSILERSWFRRFWWGLAGMPGYTMIDVTLRDGTKLGFAGLSRRLWRVTLVDLRRLYPALNA